MLENDNGSVVFKLDDHNCLTILDGKLIVRAENEDKESLLFKTKMVQLKNRIVG